MTPPLPGPVERPAPGPGAGSGSGFLLRLRHSLALRLAALQALTFTVGALALFGVLYWVLATELENRERADTEARAADLAGAYDQGGVLAVRSRLAGDGSPALRTLFVRLIDPSGQTSFVAVPAGWIEPAGRQVLVPDGWGGWSAREVHSVRVPADALRDVSLASRLLGDGRLLQVGRTTDSRAVLLAPLRRAFAWGGALSLLSTLVLGTGLAWRATRPLREVSSTAERILTTGDSTARVPAGQEGGELAILVRQLNTLLDRNAHHVRVLRETLDNLAHDLRTPLTRLRGTAELALIATEADAAGGRDAREALADCVEQTDRVLHLLETLLDLSAAEGGVLPLNRTALDLRELLVRAADLYSEVAEQAQVAVALEPGPPVLALADPVRLGQAVSNLLDNALKFTPAGGRVRLAVDGRDGRARLVVEDNGPGVPAREREAIWRRLYRGDASRSQRGLGLGLSLVKAVVEAHAGSVRVDEAPGGGARFTLDLPLLQDSGGGPG